MCRRQHAAQPVGRAAWGRKRCRWVGDVGRQLECRRSRSHHSCVSCAANQGLVLSVLTPIDWETART